MYKLCSLYTQWDKTHHGYAVKPWQRKCKISWSLLWYVQPLSLDISQTQQDICYISWLAWNALHSCQLEYRVLCKALLAQAYFPSNHGVILFPRYARVNLTYTL